MESFEEFLIGQVGLVRGDRLAIVADAERAVAAGRVAAAAAARGAQIRVEITTVDYRSERDMPAAALEACAAADAVLLFVTTDRAQFGGHADFRKAASARGARLGFVLDDRLPADADELMAATHRTRRLAALLSTADTATLRTAAGTHLELDLRGRNGIEITPDLRSPGAWGVLPDYMEAAVAPVEGTARGKIVVDGTCTHCGRQRPSDPMTVTVRDGFVEQLAGGTADQLRRYLAASGDRAAWNVAELGIGTNHLVSPSDLVGTFVDKRIAGTAHIGIGDNLALEGRTAAPLHTDIQVLDATIALDGQVVVADGAVQL
jgi:leucyl aminopeptidase (aminopeptidase T)